MSISIYNIEEFVSDELINRARVIIDSGLITEVEEQGNGDYTAVVIGGSTYSVNIVLDKDANIFTHQCNCPYSAGPICKHKVAVILLLRSSFQNDIPISKGSLSLVNTKLESCDRLVLHQLIMTLCKRDKRIRDIIKKELDIKPKL